MAALSLCGVSKVYRTGIRALDDLSFDVGDGQMVVVLGGSGCGKSTLLRVASGLEEPTTGQVLLDGVDVDGVPPTQRGVAMVFQNPALYPQHSVAANIGFPLRAAGVHRTRVEGLTRVWARRMGVLDLLDVRPHELDVEQQQRVSVARAMVRSPRLLLLDEPVSRVPAGAGARLLAEIVSALRESGTTALLVTADPDGIPVAADRIVVMREGRMEDTGSPRRVYSRPDTVFSASLVGGPSTTLLDAEVEVEDGSYTAVWLAEGATLPFPSDHLLARQLAHFHGDRVVVGIPPEAVRVVEPAPNVLGAPVLQGVVRRVVPLGRHVDVVVDIGGVGVDLDRAAPGPGRTRRGAHDRRRDVARRPGPRGDLSEIPRASADHPAELTIRVPRAGALHPGRRVFVAVDLDRVHFFDTVGRRIRSGWR